MRASLLAAVAATLLLAPAASAADEHVVAADCVLSPPTMPGPYASPYYEDLTVYAAVDAPVPITVDCYFVVDGVPQTEGGLSASGVGAAAGHTTGWFRAYDTDVVDLCRTVDFTGPGDTTPTDVHCDTLTARPIVPDEVGQAVGDAFAATGAADPYLCPVTEGDVTVDGELIWDCPPYEE